MALDQKYISKEAFEKIYKQAEKVSKMDSGFGKYLRSQLNKPLARLLERSGNPVINGVVVKRRSRHRDRSEA